MRDLQRTLEDRIETLLADKVIQECAGPLLIGPLSFFSAEELQGTSRKIIVRNGSVYLIGSNTLVHEEAVGFLQEEITDSLRDVVQTADVALAIRNNTVIDGIPDLYGCSHLTCKTPDITIYVKHSGPKPRRRAAIVAEVAFRHQSLSVLLQEGANLLSPHTDISLALLVRLIETEVADGIKDVTAVRFILMERSSPLLSRASHPPPAPEGLQLPWHIYDEDISVEETRILPVLILHDFTLTRQDVEDPAMQRDLHIPLETLENHEKDFGMFRRGTVGLNCARFARRFFADTDQLHAMGAYPSLA